MKISKTSYVPCEIRNFLLFRSSSCATRHFAVCSLVNASTICRMHILSPSDNAKSNYEWLIVECTRMKNARMRTPRCVILMGYLSISMLIYSSKKYPLTTFGRHFNVTP